VRRNPQHRNILTIVSAISAPRLHYLRLSNFLERISRPSFEPLYATDTSHRKQETFRYECPLHWFLLIPFAHTKTHSRTLLLGSILLKNGRRFDYRNQPLNIRMRVCYLPCHEDGLCCYLVMHIQNILRPLQLFCFYLWPTYWFSVVLSHVSEIPHYRPQKNIMRKFWFSAALISNKAQFTLHR
jgi:hypothetical protein